MSAESAAEPGQVESQAPAETNLLPLHQRLGDLSTRFHLLQDELLDEPGAEQGEKLGAVAADLVGLCEERVDQVLGELFLSEHSNYNFTKPLYVAASLTELIRCHRDYDTTAAIDDDKRLRMVIAALGYNLGLLAYEKQVYQSTEEFSPQQKKELRAHYPQRSAEILKAAGQDHPLVQDIALNHNVASENPSQDALMMRTPFIYAGVAMPQNLAVTSQFIDNPSREFAKMFTNKELDPVFGGLFLKINGLAPIGSILKLESNEMAMVLTGPQKPEISSSIVRMLANRNGVQLMKPGEFYALCNTPTAHRGLADHHHFAWTNFSPHEMWQK